MTEEQFEISSDVHEKYRKCCKKLLDLAETMKTCCPRGPTLNHQLFTSIRDEAPSDCDWIDVISHSKTFRKSRLRKNEKEWQEWERFPSKFYYSRYYGTGDPTILKRGRSWRQPARRFLRNIILSTCPC